MHELVNLFINIPLILYYWLESIILFFIPKRYKDITGEITLITGAGNGIGRELSLEFASYGARLVLLDINVKGLNETRDLIAQKFNKNIDVFIYECDVSNRHAVYTVATKIKDEVGKVNILVNNAGIVNGKNFLDCPDELIQKTMDVNVMAHFWTCKAFLPDMMANNHGHIVNVTSMASFVCMNKLIDYCVSKSAASTLDENLRLELEFTGYNGIKTTMIAPGFINTGLFEGFDSLFQTPLSSNEVAKQVISAVLSDQEVMILPHWFSVFFPIKGLLPRKALRHIYKSAMLSTCMNNFQGRKKTD